MFQSAHATLILVLRVWTRGSGSFYVIPGPATRWQQPLYRRMRMKSRDSVALRRWCWVLPSFWDLFLLFYIERGFNDRGSRTQASGHWHGKAVTQIPQTRGCVSVIKTIKSGNRCQMFHIYIRKKNQAELQKRWKLRCRLILRLIPYQK